MIRHDNYIAQLLRGYSSENSHFDEMLEADGAIRERWKPLFNNISEIGLDELNDRDEEMQRQLIENGVTYNVYTDPQGVSRPWNLNPMPYTITSDEWKNIEDGLKQRAELLNLVLKDIYGERRLIKNGLLPLELVYLHHGFLRSCDKVRLNYHKQLVIYAADIARGSDGNMHIINDRTQAPSGMGYALENRLTMGRVLPELFHNAHVRKLSQFFNALHDAFLTMTPRRKENPRVVAFTPGPLNETYFEHAYLASTFGFVLAQGGDLIVRNQLVWLKTLQGLKRVDVILRRVDDTYCDPLELYEHSQLGVAGLLEVARNNRVAMVNPLGAGVLENPGLMAFMPQIARYYYNDDLILKGIPTWWCGDALHRKYVLDNLKTMIIKPINRQYGQRITFGQNLTNSELDNLAKQIKKHPQMYVGQEQMQFSTTPVFVNGALEPRMAALRCFLVANDKGYIAMSGGLVRTASRKGDWMVSNQQGGISQDAWVLADTEDKAVRLLTAAENTPALPIDLASLPSRTAENLFWVGRYAGRSLASARVLRAIIRAINERTQYDDQANQYALNILLKTLTQFTMTYPGFVGEGGEERLDNPIPEILSIAFQNERIGSLSNTLLQLKRTNQAVRNLWSADTWRVFEQIEKHWDTLQKSAKASLRELQNGIDQLVTRLAAYMWHIRESVTMEQGRLLYEIGLSLEKSLLLVSEMRAALVFEQPDMVEHILLQSVLNSNESLNIYRYTYRSNIKLQYVVELLLLDINYPTSLAFHLDFLQKNLSRLPRKQVSHHLNTPERLIFEAFSKLRLADSEALIQKNDEDSLMYDNLENLLSDLTDLLVQTSNEITKMYFSHTQESQQIVQKVLTV